MTRLRLLKSICVLMLLCALTAIAASAQAFTTLINFDGRDGNGPAGTLIQGLDGNYYGTTMSGGAGDGGTVFRVTPGGTLTILHSFAYGRGPMGGLLLGTDGDFYGTSGDTIFKITAGRNLTTLYNFCSQPNCNDGDLPFGSMVQGNNGNLYGATLQGGANGEGTIFEVTRTGKLTTLYSFCSQSGCADGKLPAAGLAQATDGNFYGTTTEGGKYFGGGTIFKITPKGKFTTIYNFCAQSNCIDGQYPAAALTQGVDGYLYGTTEGGGNTGYGTAFRITPTGKLTSIYSFCSQQNCADGELPQSSLVQGTDGNFYGTAESGGAFQHCSVGFCGTVFEISPTGELTTLQSFDGDNGSSPITGLLQGTNGKFYGTTSIGGTYQNGGTVFSLDTGLGPFVAFVRGTAKAGATFGILGQGFTGTSSVSLNGSAAAFTVVSDTLIRATVPGGATSGYVTVTTPSGTLTRNVQFQVIQ